MSNGNAVQNLGQSIGRAIVDFFGGPFVPEIPQLTVNDEIPGLIGPSDPFKTSDEFFNLNDLGPKLPLDLTGYHTLPTFFIE